MPELSRRSFIRGAAAMTGAAAVAVVAPAVAPAVAAPAVAPAVAAPAEPLSQSARRGRHGDIRDIKRVVILMQENAASITTSDLKGVRGFGDRSTITLPGGYSVFQQPTNAPGETVTSTQYPWR